MNPFLLSPRSGSQSYLHSVSPGGGHKGSPRADGGHKGSPRADGGYRDGGEQWSWGSSVIIVVLAVRGDTMGCAW